MRTAHAQFDSRRFCIYVGAWFPRLGLGLMAGSDEEGCATIALLIGPFYVGAGVFR